MFDEKMKRKRKWFIIGLAVVVLSAYGYAYYRVRRDHILVRRAIPEGTRESFVLRNHIIAGRFGPGRGGILVSCDLIGFCNLIFTPLKKLEELYWNEKTSNHELRH